MYFVNLPTQERQKIAEAVASVASMDQNLPIEQTHFSLPAIGCDRR